MIRVTLEEIARLAGVSRGMVDRVYHGRGYVKAEKAARIRELLERFDYRPNKLARALSVSQKRKHVGVILNSMGNDYFNQVIDGIQHAADEFSSYGLQVTFEYLKGFEAADQLAAIRRVHARSIDALVLTPVNDPTVAAAINRLTEAGVPVITVNTDIDHCSRNLYIGCDYRKSGEMAGGFLTIMNQTKESRVGIIQGSEHAKGHHERLAGFRSVLSRHPEICVCACVPCDDDDKQAYQQTRIMLASEKPDFLYVVAGGLAGVMQALREGDDSSLISPVRVISNDLTPAAIEGLRKDQIVVTIDQQPFQQGYQAIRALFEHIYQDTDISHKSNSIQLAYVSKYNLPDDGQQTTRSVER